MTKSGALRTAREVLLTTGAILGVLCIVVTFAGAAFGVKPLMFRSGSMSPAIQTGDLAFSRTVDAARLHKGDIVSVIDSGGNRVTHRLVSAARQGDARQLKLKGDANRTADDEIYTLTQVQRVMFNVPKAGYVVSAASSRAGVFILGLYVSLLLVLAFRRPWPGDEGDPNPDDRKPGGGRKAEKGSRRGLARSAIAFVIATGTATAVISASGPSWAAHWTDGVPITSSNYTAGVVPAPATFTCGALGVLSVTFNWAAVSGATGYTVHYGSGGITTLTTALTTATIVTAISGGTAWVVAEHNYGSTTWTSVASTTRTYTVAVVSLCS
ncbi:MAG: signal peptidase I [Aeromicrobium sp.]